MYTDSYTYDLAGNRGSATIDASTVYYFYNALNQLGIETSDSAGNIPLISYYYDNNGSLTNKSVYGGDSTVYTYNLQNRLKTATIGTGNTIAYKYDLQGIRISKQIGTASAETYLIDPQNPTGYAQVLESSDGISYVLGHDVLAQADSTNLYHMIYDGQGSVRHLANNAGTVAESYSYDAYGNRLDSTLASTCLLYTGEWFDSDSSQYYLRSRWYNPTSGVFNRMDDYSGSIRDPQSLHKYLYCHGNPINGTDPSGMFFSSSNFIYGQIVHDKIGLDFVPKGFDRLYDASINTILGTKLNCWGLDRPDLVDRATDEVYEIKPAGSYLLGVGQLGWYISLLNTSDSWHRTWMPGMSYMPPYYISINATTFATVSPPVAGVILYQVVDLKPAIALVTAYTSYRIYQSVTTAIMLNSLVPAF